MNKVSAANAALWDLVEATFPTATRLRNSESAKAFESGDFVIAQMDDRDPEVLAVMSGGICDLKLTPTLTFALKGTSAEREAEVWEAVETLRLALAADVTLGGAVDDARLEGVEPAELEAARYAAGGLDVLVRLLATAPSKAG